MKQQLYIYRERLNWRFWVIGLFIGMVICRMAGRHYELLEDFYDRDHRGRKIADGQVRVDI